MFEEDKAQWEETKSEWKRKIDKVQLPDEIQGKIPYYESELDALYTEALWEYQDFYTQLENIENKIEAVKKTNRDKGKNKEERSANAYRHLQNFPSGEIKDPNTTNLLAVRDEYQKRVNFYQQYVLKAIEEKSNRLKTSVGALKVDAQFTPNTNTHR